MQTADLTNLIRDPATHRQRGRVLIGQSWHIVVARQVDPGYSALSLTVIRMLPIFLSLTGTDSTTRDRLFLGWFGPRGLASVVFAVIVLDSGLPGAEFISLVVVFTVLLSLVLHGFTAKPLTAWLLKNTGNDK